MSDIVKNTSCPTDTPRDRSIYGSAENTSNLNRIYDDSFDTILDLPPCLKKFNRSNEGTKKSVSLDSLELNVRTFPIPELSIPSDKIPYGVGHVTEAGTKYDEFPDITIQFKLNDTLKNYWTLYKWMNMLIDIENGVTTGFEKPQYSTTYNVFMLNQYKKPIGLWTFHGVIPTNLGNIDLNQNTTGQPIYIDFTFSFDYFTFDLREDIDN